MGNNIDILCVNEIAKKKGITMEEIANKIGINRITLYTSLKNNPSLKRLIEVANALNVEVKDLFKSSNNNVSGYLDYNGFITKISSIEDVKEWLKDKR